MRPWQWWQRGLSGLSQFLSRQSPPQIVEAVMLLLAMILCMTWLFLQGWQYLVLSLSYLSGAIASVLVREILRPSAYTRWIRLVALVSLVGLVLIGFYLAQETPLLIASAAPAPLIEKFSLR